MKKITFIVLAMVCPVIIAMAQEFDNGILHYRVLDESMTVEVSMGTLPEGVEYVDTLIIPEQIIDPVGGVTYTVTSIADRGFADCAIKRFLSVPATVKRIGEFAFSFGMSDFGNWETEANSQFEKADSPDSENEEIEDEGLTVELNEGIEMIDDGAFMNNPNLRHINFPEGLKEISYFAFYKTVNLEDVILPESLEYIGYGAFQHCTALHTVLLPESGFYMDWNVFDGTKSLRHISVPGAYKEITYGFFQGSGLQTIELQEGIEKVEAYGMSGTEIEELYLPDGFRIIDSNAFSENNSLKKVRIPESLESIGRYSFYHCKHIEEVEYFTDMPIKTTLAYDDFHPIVFDDYVYRDATLYVRKGKLDLYKQVEPWRYFKHMVEVEDREGNTAIGEDMEPEENTQRVYDLYGREITGQKSMPHGIYISVDKNGKSEKSLIRP